MNANQKKALQIHHPDLVRDLELRPDLIASFIHLGLFNEDMIDEFQVCHHFIIKDVLENACCFCFFPHLKSNIFFFHDCFYQNLKMVKIM